MLRAILAAILVLALIPTNAIAAFNVKSIGEVNASGANAQNSGIFSHGGANFITDWTTDTNTANTSSPVVSSATHSALAGESGHWFFVKSGTNFYPECWYPISSVGSGKYTLNAAIGAGFCIDNTKGMPSPKFSATTVAGIASVGTPTGGVGGPDFSINVNSYANGTDGASSNATTNPCQITSASGPFSTHLEHNSIRISAGTNATVGDYEIVSVSGSTLTLDKACGSSASISNFTWRIGGAFQMGNSRDDSWLENFTGTNGTGAGRVFIKAGTHTPNGVVSMTSTGGSQAPVVVEGYNSLRGDAPTWSNRPLISFGSNSLTLAARWHLYNVRISGTAATLYTTGSDNVMWNVSAINTSTIASRVAINPSTDTLLGNGEFVSLRGIALNQGNASGVRIIGNWMHSSDKGFVQGNASTNQLLVGNVLEDIVTYGLHLSAGVTNTTTLHNNTIACAPNVRGTGFLAATGSTDISMTNNIIWGCTTGISHTDTTQFVAFLDYNNYYNNTTDRSGVAIGANDRALDPQFTSVAQVTDTGATSSGAVLTASGAKDLSAVVAGRDYLYISSGTGVTAGMYDIASVNDGADTVTSNLTIGTGSNITWSIVTGRNYCIGTNLKGLGFGGFSGGYTTSSVDIGGCQRTESSGGGMRVY